MDFNQIINKIGKKNFIISVVAFLSLLFYCFASYIKTSVQAFGQSQSEGMGFLSDILFEDGFLLVSLVGILTILAAIAIIVTAVRGMKKENLLCTYIGAGLGVLSLICAMIKTGSMEKELGALMGGGGNLFGGMSYNIGTAWGLWFALIGLIACAAVAHFVTEESLEKMMAQSPAAEPVVEAVPEDVVEEAVEAPVEADETVEAAEEQTQE